MIHYDSLCIRAIPPVLLERAILVLLSLRTAQGVKLLAASKS
jgi:hypothetical protein